MNNLTIFFDVLNSGPFLQFEYKDKFLTFMIDLKLFDKLNQIHKKIQL